MVSRNSLLSSALFSVVLSVVALAVAPAASAQNTLAAPRITQPVDDARRIVLRGNTHPLARAEFDRGLAPETLPLDRMLLLLQPSEEQSAALELFLAEQQDPASANYHNWLTPKQYGERFGPAATDVDRVTRWLISHGFRVNSVSNGQTFIEFSGDAAHVREAFHTQIHRYMVDNEEHWANATDPEIPAAFAPVVAGVVSLHDFQLHATHRVYGAVSRDKATGKITPQFTIPDGSFDVYGVAPADWALQYNVTPLYTAGITGTGETVAIVGRTTIKLSDVAAFRKAFGLPALAPVVVNNGTPPALNTDDEVESLLDVEWSGAVAKGATIKFVTSASTNTTDGVFLSAQDIIDNKLASIMSTSYGACEQSLGTTTNAAINTMWKQAAGEGISAFVSTGDSGSAGCDPATTQAGNVAQLGLAVSGLSSTPYNIAVGGTDFGDYNPAGGTNTFSTYWNASNSTSGQSLKKSIPEVAWNDSCTIATEAVCNNPSNNGFLVVSGSGGGKSACTTFDGTCSGGYAKPSWQAGTGVPADGKRDVPDVSFFSGVGRRYSFYLICDTDISSGGTCDYSNTNTAISLGVGGTSASTPSMAGIQALINQKVKAAQGNINPTLYSLFAKETVSSCNSTNGSGSACIFNDITTSNNAMPCAAGTPNCTVTTSGDSIGILSGYKTTTGYDLATGLGSINANNLVNNWPGAVVPVPKVTLSATSEAFGNQAKGTTSAAKTITLTNSGTAALTSIAIALAGTNPTDFVESNNCGTSLAAAAKCTITLEFKPASTGNYTASVSIKDNAAGSPQTIALTGTGIVATPIVTLSETRVAFANQAKGTTSAATVVTLTNSGTAALSSLAISLTGTNPTDFVQTHTCGTTLAAGAKCTISVEFKPAAAAAYSAAVTIKDNASPATQTIALTGTGVTPAPAVTLSATKIAFPNQAAGTTSAATVVTLTNSGTATLSSLAISVTGTAPTDFVQTHTCGTTLAAGAKCTISVEFKPAAAAAYSAAVTIKDNANPTTQTIALTGTGYVPAPAVTLSETKVAFPEQAKGTTSAATVVTLTNSGTAELMSIAIALAGTNPTDFVETHTCGTTLAVAAKCTISVEFKPASNAAYSATVSIKDNASGSPQSIALTGTGTLAAPKVTLSATSEAFGNVAVGTTSAAKTVTLTNSGNAALSSIAISLAGTAPADFTESNTCGTSLAVAAKCTLTLAFKPAAVASYAATVEIKDNATGSPQSIALTGAGIANANAGSIVLYAGDGLNGYSGDGAAATKAKLYYPHGTVEDSAGNLYLTDEGNNVVRKVTAATGVITTYAGDGYGAEENPGGYSGDGGPATKAELGGPNGLAIDKSGNLYIADFYNSAIRKVTASTGIITTVAGNGTYGYTGDGGAATSAELGWPKAVALDSAGNIYISDSTNYVIRKVTIATGKITTIAGGGNGCSNQSDEYGDGCPAVDAVLETGNGLAGTGGIAVDKSGNVFISCPDEHLIREIVASNGTIKRVAGNGFMTDTGAGGYTGDKGSALSAELNFPTDVKLDGAGNLFISDADNNVIREVTASTGIITSIAGVYHASGGGKMSEPIIPFVLATAQTFQNPGYISIDPSGNLYISDINDFEVDKVLSVATPLPVN